MLKQEIREVTPIFREAGLHGALFEREGNEVIDYISALHKTAYKKKYEIDIKEDKEYQIKSPTQLRNAASPTQQNRIYSNIRSISLPSLPEDEIINFITYRKIINLLIELNSMVTDNVVQHLKFKNRHHFIRELSELDSSLDDMFDILGIKKIKLLKCFEKYGYSIEDEIIYIKDFAANVDSSHGSYYDKKQKDIKRKLIVPKEPEKIHMNDFLDDFNFWNFNSEKNTRLIILLQNLNNLKLETVINSWEKLYPRNTTDLIIIQRAFEKYIEKFTLLFKDLTEKKLSEEKIDKICDNASKFFPKSYISN